MLNIINDYANSRFLRLSVVIISTNRPISL